MRVWFLGEYAGCVFVSVCVGDSNCLLCWHGWEFGI